LTTKARTPVITELHFTAEELDQVQKIEKEIYVTKRRDKLRAVLKGPMCCGIVPSFHVQYPGSPIRIERYCEKCFHEVYEYTVDITNDTIAELYGCVKGDLPC
jgi:hypothetical protein